VSPEWLARLDEARGVVRRGTFVKRTLEQALGGELSSGRVSDAPAPVRASDTLAKVREDLAREGVERPSEPSRRNRPSRVHSYEEEDKTWTPLPKIAPRR
jgi:hypothetical protein